MSKLEEARNKINEIDEQLAKLFEERMSAVEDVAKYKMENHLEVEDEQREKALAQENVAFIHDEKYKDLYLDWFQHTLEISKNYQKELVNKDLIGYGGTTGAFSHIAAMNIFPHNRLKAYTDFEEVVKAVECGDVQYGVIPFENSFTGEVGETSDLLRIHDVYIQTMYDLKIVQNLLGVKGATIKDIKEVYSHSQGLSQSALFLKGRDIEKKVYPNTALAAEYVAKCGDKTKAAIASKETAKIFGLDILEEHINTASENTTRFIVISKELKEEGDHFQIMFTTKNETGALAAAINCIAYYEFNMISIKSRAIPDTPWEFYFHVEIDGCLHEERAKKMLEALSQHCTDIRILGGYYRKEGE